MLCLRFIDTTKKDHMHPDQTWDLSQLIASYWFQFKLKLSLYHSNLLVAYWFKPRFLLKILRILITQYAKIVFPCIVRSTSLNISTVGPWPCTEGGVGTRALYREGTGPYTEQSRAEVPSKGTWARALYRDPPPP